MKVQKHILVVDDDNSSVRTLEAILRSKGYRATGAFSGKEAIKLVEDIGYDYVLTDVKMPEMNGVELFRRIKKLKPNLPVLLMTAYASQLIIQEALSEGAIDCMTKPLDIDRMLKLIN